MYAEDHVVAYCNSKSHKGALLYLSGLPRRLCESDKHLIKRFSNSVQLAFDNVLKTVDLEGTQREIIERLGHALEHESNDANHIKRMAEMAGLMASKLSMPEQEIDTFKLAVSLHDVGTSHVPRAILHKTTELTEDDIFAIRQHAEFGYQILKDSSRPTIQLAATLARQHHERWDGEGYPEGLKGEEIDQKSRIATLIDVFDALLNERPYKPAWSVEKVVNTLKEESGRHFEPTLVTRLLNNLPAFLAIQAQYPNKNL